MKLLNYRDKNFDSRLKKLLSAVHEIPPAVTSKVDKIFNDVAKQGDPALFKWTKQLDQCPLTSRTVKVTNDEISSALDAVPKKDIKVINHAARRITAFHKKRLRSWMSALPPSA